MAISFNSVKEILRCDHSNETRLSGQNFHVVPFIYFVAFTFESTVDEILWCAHLNETICFYARLQYEMWSF